MTVLQKQAVGKYGEDLAATYLAHHGYQVIQRNYRTPWGEVDIVCRRGAVTVFVEVKTKRGESYGRPWEMVSRWKARQVERMGELWCQDYRYSGQCRVDVVGIVLDHEGRVESIDHWENVSHE